MALLAVFAFGLSWRMGYLSRLSRSPLADHLQGDEHIYWDWASALIEHDFRATNPFFFGPLYPYCLAVLRAVTRLDISEVLAVQVVIGSLSAVLIADAARRLSRPNVAFAVGMVFAAYEMCVHFDTAILSESLLLFLGSAMLWLLSRVVAGEAKPVVLALLGCVVGLAASCRATSVLLILPALLGVVPAGAVKRAADVRRAAVVALAFVLTCIPAALSNWQTAREFIPFTYNFGYNLYIGNNPRANGAFVAVTTGLHDEAVRSGRADGGIQSDGREYLEKQYGLELGPGESSAYWANRAFEFVRSEPGRAAGLLLKKFLLLLNHSEVPQLESVQMYRQFAGPLGLPFVGSFAFVGIFGLVGATQAHHGGRYGKLVRWCLILTMAGVLPFFVTDRYRAHLIPSLTLLSAISLERGLVLWSSGTRRGLGSLMLAGMGGATILALPVRGDDVLLERWTLWRDVGIRWAEHGAPREAIASFERALAVQRASGMDRNPDPAAAEARGLLAFNYGVALHQLKRDDEALPWLASAAREDPHSARYVRTLADAYRLSGDRVRSDSLMRRIGSLVGGEGQMLISEGWQAMLDQRPVVAESLFSRAIEVDENQFGAWTALIRVQVERKRLREALRTLEGARRVRVPQPMLLAHEALIHAAAGDSVRAMAALARIRPEDISANHLLQGVVGEAHRLIGRPEK